MKEYYEILDVPITATPEEIKAQYRQLVRVYHPDRFRNQDDKAYAEEKLKEINIAFQVLSGTSVRRGPFEARVAPQPVAYPPQLDFGTLQIGQRAKQKLQIGNLGGNAEQVGYAYSCENPWFQLSKGKQVYADQSFPIEFEITVDSRRLKPEQTYHEWLEIVLDGMPVRVSVQAKTVARRKALGAPRPMGWSAVALFVCLIALWLSTFFGLAIPTTLLPSAFLSARPSYELRESEMLFALNEESESVLYVGLGDGNTPRRLGFSGEGAVGTQLGQRVAYLDTAEGAKQVFLFDLAEGAIRQLTRSIAEKAMLAWSPDGVRLGYLVGQGDERKIAIYDVRTGQEYLLPGEVSAGVDHFSWSPDGQSLLFDLWEGDEQRVYRMGVQGNDLRQLTHFDSWAGAWSPDGTQILVGTKQGLYKLSSNGQQLHQLTNVPAHSFSWSADGQWIAYTASNAPANLQSEQAATSDSTTASARTFEQLWLVDRYGGEPQPIANEVLSHQWSPQGAMLGYITGNASTVEPLLYLWKVNADAATGGSPSLVAEVNSPFFTWPR